MISKSLGIATQAGMFSDQSGYSTRMVDSHEDPS